MRTMKTILTLSFFFSLIFILPPKSKGQDGETHHKEKRTIVIKDGVSINHFGDDSIVIYIDKKGVNSDWSNWSTFPFWCKKGKFNGHWAGVDFGWNGYANRDFNMNFKPEDNYLNLNTARSLMVSLNPIELNLNLVKNKFGFTSGLGFQLNNYYFTGTQTLISDSSHLVAYQTVDDKGNPVAMKVNKLFIAYLNLPLLFEYQTNAGHRLNSFHIAAGVIAGVRIGSYTKQRLYEWNDTYYLADQNGKTVASFYAGNAVIRNHNPYHLNPFKMDATIRVGWSWLNLWGTYSIVTLFEKNQGPEVYPWNIGITLAGW